MKPEILKEVFGDMTAYHFFVWLIFVAAVVGIIIAGVKVICKIAEKYRIEKTAHDQRVKQVEQNRENIKELQETDATIINSINSLSVKMDSLSDQIKHMQELNNAAEIAKAKDWIAQAYKLYTDPSRNGEWSEIEADAFWSRFDSYTAHGGNSWVHDIVEPEMRKLKIK